MKSLLFLGTGAVLHATGERNLGRLGGLIHRMPWVAWLTLVGALAIAGLPPLNGFVSEWLLLQAFLFAHEVPHTFVNMLLPLGAAVIALAAALAGYVMVKFFGVIFLGQPREAALARAHDAGLARAQAGLAWLAPAACARPAARAGDRAARLRRRAHLRRRRAAGRGSAWSWLLVPLPDREASYAPLAVRCVIAAVVAADVLLVVRLSTTAACAARRPGTAASRGSTRACRTRPRASASRSGTSSSRSSRCSGSCQRRSTVRRATGSSSAIASGGRCYQPLGGSCSASPTRCAWLQQGRISTYLLYSFVTLVVLLALVL